jgi:hypothetical protein
MLPQTAMKRAVVNHIASVRLKLRRYCVIVISEMTRKKLATTKPIDLAAYVRASTKPDSTDDLIVTGDLMRVGCRLGLELG